MKTENEIENLDYSALKNELEKYTIKTPRFTLKGLKKFGRLVDIIDGDSLSIILPVYNNYYKFNVRLNGIDTSEIHSHNEDVKHFALNTRNELLKIIIQDNNITSSIDTSITKHEIQEILEENLAIVFVECLEFDKYGRLLADVYCFNKINKNISSKTSFNKQLINENLAYSYDGKTKLKENEQIDELVNISIK